MSISGLKKLSVPQSIFGVLTRGLDCKRGHSLSGEAPLTALSGPQSLLQGDLSSHQNCVKPLWLRQVPNLADAGAPAISFSQREIPGEISIWELVVHQLNCLILEVRAMYVSLKHLHSYRMKLRAHMLDSSLFMSSRGPQPKLRTVWTSCALPIGTPKTFS